MFPIAIIIVVVIYIDNRGPVIFRQKRIGLCLKPFTLYKFRSMTVNKGSLDASFDIGNQSRITRFGKILRKTKLDELPQLFNVMKGDMSIVGPRPEVMEIIDIHPEKWSIVHNVKPGLTDNASIEFRNEEQILMRSKNPKKTYVEEILPIKLNLYEQYVKTQSFFGDLKIILKTIYVVIFK